MHNPEDAVKLNACRFANEMAELLSTLFGTVQETVIQQSVREKLTCVHADCKLLLDSPLRDFHAPDYAASNAPCWPKARLSHNLFLTSFLLISTLRWEEVGLTAGKPQQWSSEHWDSVG